MRIVPAALLVVLSAVQPALALEGADPAPPVSPLRQLSNAFADVFERVAPSVVVIEATVARGGDARGLPGGLNFFFQGPGANPLPDDTPNVGSGIIFTPEGHILTNQHVVDEAGKISVTLRDGREFPATIVGEDARGDIAVLKIDGPDLPVAEFGDSDAVRVGELAFAIGTPMELPYTFTFGIVSAKNRTLGLGGNYDEFIQTDTSINPGNSGGPLCDIDGRVIGISTIISGINRGVGFAIPINEAADIAGQLISKGRVSRPWIGISIASLEDLEDLRSLYREIDKGVVVRGIEPGAPAQRSNLMQGDVITGVDGKRVTISAELQREILRKAIGQTVELEVWRRGRTLTVPVITGEWPDKFLRASFQGTQEPPALGPEGSIGTGLGVETVDDELLKKFGITDGTGGGVIVTSVEPLSPASGAGLQPGDIITEAGGRPVVNASVFRSIMDEVDLDRGILLLLERDGQKTFAILKE